MFVLRARPEDAADRTVSLLEKAQSIRKLTKLRSTYLGPLQRATQTPVCTRYNVLVANNQGLPQLNSVGQFDVGGAFLWTTSRFVVLPDIPGP